MQTDSKAGAEARLHPGWAATLEPRFALLYDPAHPEALQTPEGAMLLAAICDALEAGYLRLLEPAGPGEWRVQVWLKRALLALGAAGTLSPQPGPLPGVELDTLGWTQTRSAACRVPAGSFIRRGAFLAPGCVVMPPTTVQTGACLMPGAQVDSHALIGSGARLQEDVHVGCGTMIGGVLMPEEALPIILDRGVMIGGNCGLYGSMVVGQAVQIYAGTIIRAAEGLYDTKAKSWIRPDAGGTLRVPAGAAIQMGVPHVDAFPDGIARLTPMIC